MTIKTAQESFINHCKFEKKLSNKTIQFYQIDLKQFNHFLKEGKYDLRVRKIDKNVLRDYLRCISDFQPRTIKRKVATLKALFNYLEFEDILPVNPFRKLQIKIKSPRTLPTLMNTQEVKTIFFKAYSERDQLHPKDVNHRVKVRDIAVLELLFATGMRVSELCNLLKENVNLDTGIISIYGKGKKQRLIQVCNLEARESLLQYKTLFWSQIERSNYFFINRLGRRLSEQSVRYMVRRYVKLASIQKNVTPHTFRHTFATLLLEEDVDIKYIQHFLGHSSIATTQIYTHVNSAKQKQILSTKHPRNNFEFG